MKENNRTKQNTFKLDVNIATVLKDIRKWLFTLISVSMIAGLSTYVVATLKYEPVFQMSATYVVSNRGLNNNSFSNLETAQIRANRFAQILQSDVMINKVAEELDISPKQISIKPKVVNNTNLLTLQVMSDTPKLTFDIYQSVIRNYPELSQYLTGDSVLRVLVSPTISGQPINGSAAKNLAVKILIIVAAGLFLLIVLVSCVKDTIRKTEDIEEKLGSSALGNIYHEKRKIYHRGKFKGFRKKKNKESLLVIRPTVSFWYVEAVNSACRKIMSKMSTKHHKAVLITSLLENEGKSTFAANLALSLAKLDKKVVLVDMDLLQPAQYKIFDWNEDIPMILNQALEGKVNYGKAIGYIPELEIYTMFDNTKLSYASVDLINNGNFQKIISYLKERYDYIIIDTPPVSVSDDTETIAQYVDCSIAIIQQHYASAKDLNSMLDVLDTASAELLGCVLNNVYHIDSTSGNKFSFHRYGYNRYFDNDTQN